jgi:hypothetical protein
VKRHVPYGGTASMSIPVLLAVSGICYCSMISTLFLCADTGRCVFLGDLYSAGVPSRGFYSGAQIVAGSAVVIAAIAGVTRRRRVLVVTGWSAMAAFGAIVVADAMLPLRNCTADDGAFCHANHERLHHAHAVAGVVATTAILIAILALTLSARRYRDAPVLRSAGPALLGLCSVTIWCMVTTHMYPGKYSEGMARSIHIALVTAWLMLLAFANSVPGRRPARENGPNRPPPHSADRRAT